MSFNPIEPISRFSASSSMAKTQQVAFSSSSSTLLNPSLGHTVLVGVGNGQGVAGYGIIARQSLDFGCIGERQAP
jgi:hypothetical protein